MLYFLSRDYWYLVFYLGVPISNTLLPLLSLEETEA